MEMHSTMSGEAVGKSGSSVTGSVGEWQRENLPAGVPKPKPKKEGNCASGVHVYETRQPRVCHCRESEPLAAVLSS